MSIPTHNRREMLSACLDSVLEQEFPELEVFVSDNASTDGTPELVAAHDDPRIRYERLPQDIGLWRNLTRCLHLGTAPYVTVLPDDDLMLPGNLGPQVSFLNEHPRVGMVHSAFDLIDERGAILGKDVNWLQGPVAAIEPGAVYVEKMLRSRNRTCLPTVVMRRSALGGLAFDERDGGPADAGLFMRIALRWDVGYVDRPLAVCRVHPKAQTASLTGASVEGQEYRPTLAAIRDMRRTKERFLDEHGRELSIRGAPAPRRWERRAAVAIVADTALKDGSAAIARSLLAEAVVHDPGILLTPRCLALLVAMLGGVRGMNLYRRAGHRVKRLLPRPSS
ncbi:glycosyltransferase family A protein [soil metagenome]